jgi:hypothetical protein
MIAVILFAWILNYLNAPVWIWFLFGFGAVLRGLKFYDDILDFLNA